MKHILLFGAGKSATVLIDYLKKLATEYQYTVTVADGNLDNAQSKVGKHTLVNAAEVNVEEETNRQQLIAQADVVISLLPPSLHYLVAVDCVQFGKHLLTASYIDDKIQALQKQIEEKGLLFLCEMGLDPGIDHMSAMQLIHRIKDVGGKIKSFKSHCGGLVAPESDDNPWHYKISWNPRNVVLAGKAGAIYKENGVIKNVDYKDLFTTGNLVNVNTDMLLAYYPNRDSLGYIPIYHLEEASTFIRTTLRHPDFCFGWKNIIELHLTDETAEYDTDGMTIAGFFKAHFEKYGFSEWLKEMLHSRLSFAKDLMDNLVKLLDAEQEMDTKGLDSDKSFLMVNEEGQLDSLEIENVKNQAAATLAVKMHEANLSLKQLFFLGLESDELINKGFCSAADILQFILEKKLALLPSDKDMVVMLHEIEYELNGNIHLVKSSLIAKGNDSVHTAMAKTVGLPLGIAAKFILDGSLTTRGLHIPIVSNIYDSVLKELETYDIQFIESIEEDTV